MAKSNERNIEVGIVVDEYGVIIDRLYEGDRVIRGTRNEYKEKYAINFNKKELFCKVYKNPIKELWNTLSIRDYAVATALIPYISYKDGILRNENELLNMKQISVLLNMDYDSIRKSFATLLKNQIIAKVKRPPQYDCDKLVNCYAVNPYLFMSSTDIEKEILSKFKESKWAKIKGDTETEKT